MTLNHVPSTFAEWDLIQVAKQRALSLSPNELSPADFPEVRPEILVSWKRSLLAGVDPKLQEFPVDPEFTPNSKLMKVAEPILNRLSDQIADMTSWAFLTDKFSRLLSVVVAENPSYINPQLLDLQPGSSFAEDVIGTNGIGTARELQKPFVVYGPEHLRAPETITTTGVNIFDPLTRRFMGSLGVHCRRELVSPALLPLVVELGMSIENELLMQRSDGEREIFEAFSRIRRRYPGAVMAIAQDLMLSNAAARQLYGPADGELIQSIARDASLRNRESEVVRVLSNGRRIQFRTFPQDHPRGGFATVMVLKEISATLQTDLHSSRPKTVESKVAQSLLAHQPVLLAAERGAGKRFFALKALAKIGYCNPVQIDCATSLLNPQEWISEASDALTSGRGVVLLHVETTDPKVMLALAGILSRSEAPVVATVSTQIEHQLEPGVLVESFPAVIEIPPLRARTDEIAGVCESILANIPLPANDLSSTPSSSPSLTNKALAALIKQDWPGNVRQLVQVLHSAAVRADYGNIHEEHLPAHQRTISAGGNLTLMERNEREALKSVLSSCGGNRNEAAERLGISRATIYRKMRRYQLH